MVIKVLGSGCKSCIKVYETIDKVIEGKKDIEVIKVTDFKEIMKYKVMRTPAIVINEKVIMQGKIPNEKQIEDIITNNIESEEISNCDCSNCNYSNCDCD